MCLCSAASSLAVWCHQASSGKHVRRPLKSCGGSRASRFSVCSRYRLAKFWLCHADAETNKDQWDVQSFLNLIFSPWGKKIGSSLAHRCWRDPKMLVMSISGSNKKRKRNTVRVSVRLLCCEAVCVCMCVHVFLRGCCYSPAHHVLFSVEKKRQVFQIPAVGSAALPHVCVQVRPSVCLVVKSQ